MTPLLHVVQKSASYLADKGVARPKRLAEEAIALALGLKRIELFLQHDRPLEESELKACRALLKRVATFEPLQYIEGEVSFCDLSLKVTPAVLIPRPETEELVHLVATTLKEQDLGNKVLFDVCTGSGCLAIALKKRFPALKVVASDLCNKALAVAQENAQQCGADITFLKGDFLKPFLGQKADFLVSNPPYVSEAEYAALEPTVKEFEPKKALVASHEGLAFYKRFSSEFAAVMQPGGKAWFEIGATQGGALLDLFRNKGTLLKDLSNKDRFFFLETDLLS